MHAKYISISPQPGCALSAQEIPTFSVSTISLYANQDMWNSSLCVVSYFYIKLCLDVTWLGTHIVPQESLKSNNKDFRTFSQCGVQTSKRHCRAFKAGTRSSLTGGGDSIRPCIGETLHSFRLSTRRLAYHAHTLEVFYRQATSLFVHRWQHRSRARLGTTQSSHPNDKDCCIRRLNHDPSLIPHIGRQYATRASSASTIQPISVSISGRSLSIFTYEVFGTASRIYPRHICFRVRKRW